MLVYFTTFGIKYYVPLCKVTLNPVAGQLSGKPWPAIVISPPKLDIMLGVTVEITIFTVKSMDRDPPYGSQRIESKYYPAYIYGIVKAGILVFV